MGPKKVKTQTMPSAIKIKPKELEAPFNWIKELPELEPHCKELLSMEDWLLRHCSDKKCNKTLKVQPLKLLIRGCLQTFIDYQSDLVGIAQNRMNWLRQLFTSSSNANQLSEKNIDPEGIKYILDCMDWLISTNPGQPRKDVPVSLDFKKLSKSAQTTVRSSKLLFYGTAHFPLKIQRRLAIELVGVEEGCKNFEVVHQYVRILRKCRHQKRKENLGLSDVLPTHKELSGINEALTLDPSNYKIKVSVCELLFDFVKLKLKAHWKPFQIGKQVFQTPEDIVRFLDTESRELLVLNSRSVRLNNFATKLNICRYYRDVFQDVESRKFGIRKVDTSISMNPKSSSANYLIGQRNITFGNYDEAVNNFQIAMSTKPLSPKYTLAYIRALVASLDKERVAKKSQMVSQIRNIIQEKILFGTKHKWADWNIHHLQFLSGLLTWITVGHNEAFQEWLHYYADMPIFEQQFNYLTPFGLTRLMLRTERSAVNCSELLEFCQELENSKTILPLENDFINSLQRTLNPPPPTGTQNDLIIYNKSYQKNLRPAHEMIKIKEKEETSLQSSDWARLQEKKLMAEIDQGKLIGNQAWYKENVLQLMDPTSSDTRQIRNPAILIKKEKEEKVKKKEREEKVKKKEKEVKKKEMKTRKMKMDKLNDGMGDVGVQFTATTSKKKFNNNEASYDFFVR